MAYSEAHKRATLKYRKKSYKRIAVDLKTEEYERISEAAAAVGEPLATYVKGAINERMERGY